MREASPSDRFDPAEEMPAVALPSGYRAWTLLGLFMLTTAFGGFGLWAATVPLDSAVVASGKIAVAGKRKVVQHLEGGIIQKLAVRDGNHVEDGDVLIEFDPTRAKTRVAITRTGYLSALAAEARLEAERDGRATVEFPSELAVQTTLDAEIAELVKSQRRIFTTRKQESEGQSSILNSRINRLAEEIRGYTAERAAAEQQVEMAREELAILEDLYRRKHTTRNRVLAARREVFQLDGLLGRLAAQIAAAEKEISETRLTIVQTQNKFMSEVAAELKTTQARVLELREQYLASQRELERTVLRAPASGTIFGSQVHTIGGVARPGETLLEIVPDHDELIVEVRLRVQDIDNVAVGQMTEVRFSGLKQRNAQTAQGQLSFVSADAFSDPREPQPYYIANIQVKRAQLERFNSLRLQPGMPCEVMIRTGERTAFTYLTQPLVESFRRAWRED